MKIIKTKTIFIVMLVLFSFFPFVHWELGIWHFGVPSAHANSEKIKCSRLFQKQNNPYDNLDKKYSGPLGAVVFADEFFNGSMGNAYQAVQEESPKTVMDLKWKFFSGNSKEFLKLRNEALTTAGDSGLKYQGQKGMILFSNKVGYENLATTHMRISSVLTESEMNQLDWKAFQGSASELGEWRSRILNNDGTPKSEYVGQVGYSRFAQEYSAGKMLIAFTNTSSVLTESEMIQLSWKQFQGSVTDFLEWRSKILNEDGQIKPKYVGQMGYAKFSLDHNHHRGMQRVATNTSSVLSEAEYTQLGWKTFKGSVEEFTRWRSLVLNKDHMPKPEYKGQMGYMRFAKDYTDGRMQSAFNNTSSVLTESEMNQLSWKQFQGSSNEFDQWRSWIFNENGEIYPQFLGQEGYLRFAKMYCQGKMQIAFSNTSSVLTASEMSQLGWRQVQASAEKISQWRSLLVDDNGQLKPEYLGQLGFAKFAQAYSQGRMANAFKNTSGVLTEGEMKQLGWKTFQGTAAEFHQWRSLILKTTGENTNGEVKPEYRGQIGYVKFSNDYTAGKMSTAFVNTSSTLTAAEFSQLGWKGFQGLTTEFNSYRNFLFHSRSKLPLQRYKGKRKGLLSAAEDWITLNRLSPKSSSRIKQNFRSVLSQEEIQLFEWDFVRD